MAPTPKKFACASCIFAIFAMMSACTLHAHPMVENALDIVIGPDKILIDARISMEQVFVASANANPPNDLWPALARAHAGYVLHHLQVRVDGQLIPGTFTATPQIISSRSQLIPYHFEYPLATPPHTVKIDQNFLREFDLWTASCIVRIRQSDDAAFSTALLTRENSAEYDCLWTAGAATRSTEAAHTHAPLGPTIRAYIRHGILHILTGYDHLLFAGALVLATTKLGDLIKVVTAFTVAHTLTLMLSVFDLVTLGERVVEPIIAASIIFVAVQNIFWPKQSRGWTRLAIAFGFGLFHGLGFAGGLKEAMSQMPRLALWTALCSFSFGVEIGHQIIVLPLYLGMNAVRGAGENLHRMFLSRRIVKLGSCAISLAGIYFLIQALK